MAKQKKTGRPGQYGVAKKPAQVSKVETTRDAIKSVLGGAKFTLKKVDTVEWSAYRLQVEGLPEGIVTITLDDPQRELYNRVIAICRASTFKGLPIIRG